MGRPLCCDKDGIKKGPWTPKEDIILASYIQEHGPGNWRSVPPNTGLLRCSKSCRLRWTNYLRPGIKRGNFTSHEERMIVQLQALLGNKWASIASYLPQRTNNDIKNYWNTHLKKKIKKFQSASAMDLSTTPTASTFQFVTKRSSYTENTRSKEISNLQTSVFKLNQTSATYASSTENISRMLKGLMKSSPKITSSRNDEEKQENKYYCTTNNNKIRRYGSTSSTSSNNIHHANLDDDQADHVEKLTPNDEFESVCLFQNLANIVWVPKSESNNQGSEQSISIDRKLFQTNDGSDQQTIDDQQPPFSFLENWLLDMIDLSTIL